VLSITAGGGPVTSLQFTKLKKAKERILDRDGPTVGGVYIPPNRGASQKKKKCKKSRKDGHWSWGRQKPGKKKPLTRGWSKIQKRGGNARKEIQGCSVGADSIHVPFHRGTGEGL